MSAGQTSQWKWAMILTNKCSRLKCSDESCQLAVRRRKSSLDVYGGHQGTKQVTLKAGAPCWHEQHWQHHLRGNVPNKVQQLLSSPYVNVCCSSLYTGENWPKEIIPLFNHYPAFRQLMAMIS